MIRSRGSSCKEQQEQFAINALFKRATSGTGLINFRSLGSVKLKVRKPWVSKNGILAVQQRSGASNAWPKIVESLKLKLRGRFLTSLIIVSIILISLKESLEIHFLCHKFELSVLNSFPFIKEKLSKPNRVFIVFGIFFGSVFRYI